jgi:hypothetical protein
MIVASGSGIFMASSPEFLPKPGIPRLEKRENGWLRTDRPPAQRKTAPKGAVLSGGTAASLALTRLEPRVLFVDDVKAAATAHDAALFVPVLHRFK